MKPQNDEEKMRKKCEFGVQKPSKMGPKFKKKSNQKYDEKKASKSERQESGGRPELCCPAGRGVLPRKNPPSQYASVWWSCVGGAFRDPWCRSSWGDLGAFFTLLGRFRGIEIRSKNGQEALKSDLGAPKSTLKSLLGALGALLGALGTHVGKNQFPILFWSLNLGSKMESKFKKIDVKKQPIFRRVLLTIFS